MSSISSAARVLVCAPTESGDDPQVVLADGSYETEAERVFWRSSPSAEVLRIPLQASVSVRPLKGPVPQQRAASDGEQRLIAALTPYREADNPESSREDALDRALRSGSAERAEEAFRAIWDRAGLPAAHRALAQHLRDAGSDWAARRVGVLVERTASATARTMLERLRRSAAPTRLGRVILAVPEGDRHVLSLIALRHVLGEAGYDTVVVEDLPLDELTRLAAEASTRAVVVSAHLPLAPTAARRLFGALREAAPTALLVGGGPGMPRASRVADVATDDVQELVQALTNHGAVLTEREREVLLAVADGLTNVEIADALCVSPATVKTHLDHVFAKTGTEHRAAAVARALRQGWIS